VGGEEDGHDTSGLPAEKLYTTPEDMVEVYEALSPIGRFLLSFFLFLLLFLFGNSFFFQENEV
jgi:hypothetical protein